jgi:hypothetical protein
VWQHSWLLLGTCSLYNHRTLSRCWRCCVKSTEKLADPANCLHPAYSNASLLQGIRNCGDVCFPMLCRVPQTSGHGHGAGVRAAASSCGLSASRTVLVSAPTTAALSCPAQLQHTQCLGVLAGQSVVDKDGIQGLLGRGLYTRLLTNGLQASPSP